MNTATPKIIRQPKIKNDERQIMMIYSGRSLVSCHHSEDQCSALESVCTACGGGVRQFSHDLAVPQKPLGGRYV